MEHKTTLYLPPELEGELRAIAREEGKSQALVMREALATYVVQRDHPLPGIVGLVDEEPADGVTSDNVKSWIRERWSENAAPAPRKPKRPRR